MSGDRPPPPNPVAFENEYVLVSRDRAPYAEASNPGSGDRVVVAMGDVALKADAETKTLSRGQFVVFEKGQSYVLPPGSSFFEVAIKPGHPPVKTPPEMIPPAKN